MGLTYKPAAITSSTQVIAQGTRGLVGSIDFFSHTSDVTVEILDGGSSGTTVWKMVLDATTAVADLPFDKTFPGDGITCKDGVYIKITGTTTVSYAVRELAN
jgi:hypothetical protein